MRDLAAQGIKIGKLISCQSNFWDSESGKMRMGEAALVMAVITKAIEDLPLILSKNERENTEGRSSFSFIFSKGLDFYADMISLNAGYVRGKITIWVRQWAGDAAFPSKIGSESVSRETRRSIVENILNENQNS